MAFTISQLNAIEAAIASGETVVHYGNKRVEYRSISELMAARKVIRDALIASGQLADTPNTNRGPASVAVFTRD